MEVNLSRVDEDFHFAATGASGVEINIDGSPEIGGHNAGARPMELLLMGLGGCSAIDIVQILKKKRQQLDSFKINVKADRIAGQVPSLFKQIHVHFILGGQLEEAKVQQAIQLSMDKYCSVAAILYKTTTISYSHELVK